MRPSKAAGITLAGAPAVEAAPPPAPPAPAPAASKAPARKQAPPPPVIHHEDEDELAALLASVPDHRARRAPARRKVDMYLAGPIASDIDRLVRYAAYEFGLKKGEVQDAIVTVGLNNSAALVRALREAAYGREDEDY